MPPCLAILHLNIRARLGGSRDAVETGRSTAAVISTDVASDGPILAVQLWKSITSLSLAFLICEMVEMAVVLISLAL